MRRPFAPVLALIAALIAAGAQAQEAVADPEAALVAARVIRAKTVLGPADVARGDAPVAGALTDPAAAIGMETRVTLYAGRPVRPSDLGPPALVERNQVVTLGYAAGRLSITAEGRALGRAGKGERVRVMNLASRLIVTGRVAGPGRVEVER